MALENDVSFEDALVSFGNITESVALMLLESLDEEGEETLNQIMEHEAEKRKAKETEAAQVTSGIVYDDDDYMGYENDTETEGVRRMRYVPNPSQRRLADIEFEITERKRRRRLTAINFEGHAMDFERRLSDHVEELQGHIRELQEACENKLDCAAEKMSPMIDDIASKGSSVTSKTRSLTMLLGEMKSAQVKLDNIDTSSELSKLRSIVTFGETLFCRLTLCSYRLWYSVFAAVTIAAVIPGIGKLVFKALKVRNYQNNVVLASSVARDMCSIVRPGSKT